MGFRLEQRTLVSALLHRNVVANIMQCESWFKPMLDKVGDQQLTIVCALPLYHIFALTICALMGARMGAMNLLIPNPRDLDGFVKTLSRTRFTNFAGVNTLFNALNNHPKIGTVDFSNVEYVVGGGMGSLSGAFLASILIGVIQTFAVAVDSSLMSLLARVGVEITGETFGYVLWKLKVSQVAPILPYLFLVLILIFRPRGLLGTREG